MPPANHQTTKHAPTSTCILLHPFQHPALRHLLSCLVLPLRRLTSYPTWLIRHLVDWPAYCFQINVAEKNNES